MNRRNTSGSLPGRVVLAGGGLATALGLAVLVGWYAHLPVLIQVSPGFFPMPANAALGFLLCGAALVALHLRRQGVAIASGLVTVAMGLATLAEYAFDWSPGLDQLLLQHYITFGTSPPGRMAPNAALCFVLAGAAVLLAGAGPRLRRSSSGLGLLGAVVCALGMTALASYVAGLSTYAWWPLTRMAAHGSVGFVVLGLAVMGLGWQRGQQGRSGPPRWLPLSVGIFAVTVTLCLWQALEAVEGASLSRAGALAAQLAPSADRVKVTPELLKDEMTVLSGVALGTGLVMSALLALAVYSAQAARRRAQAAEAARSHLEREVAQRQRAEEQLGLSEERHRLAVEAADMGTWYWDLSKDELVFSERCKAHFGLAPDATVTYEIFLNCLDPEDRERTRREVARSLEDKQDYDDEYRAVWGDGTLHWLAAKGRGQYDSAGRAVRMLGVVMDIARRKSAEAALRDSEERYRTLTEGAPQLVWTCLPDGRWDYLNSRWVEYTGRPMAEQLGYEWAQRLHPEDRPRVLAGWAAAVERNEMFDIEFRIQRADGVYRWFKTRALPLRGPDGAVVKWLGTNTDIDGQKQAEEAFRQARDQLEQRVRERTAELEQANWQLQAEISTRQRVQEERDRFFTLSRDMLCVCDFEGRLRSVNPAWERTLGFTETELKGQLVVDFVHPDDREGTLRVLQTLVSGAEAKAFQNRYRARDGSYRWFLWNAISLPERKQIYAAARDITELKQAEEVLREREERFRKLFEDAPIGISIVGADHRFARVNKALAEMVGYAEQELIGRAFGDITHPEDLARDLYLADQLFAGRIPGYRLAKRYLKKGGGVLWVSLTATIIRADDGRPLYGVNMVENLQERKQRGEQIRQLNAELQQRVAELTAVNQELEAFTYSVSHDLRAPLRHIDGFAKILAEEAGAGLDASAKECLEHIRKGSKQMGRMVDELLNLARIVRPEASRELTGLGALVEEVLSDLKPEMEGREITLEIGELPLVDCDPVLMKQVFANLFSNALKFTRPRPRAVIQAGHIRQAGQAVVFVRDNGVGFSMKYADKLFGVFQRLHRREEFEGTGIGLAIVQRIIHKHGGRVWAEAELDRGATFFFTLDPKEGQPAQDKIIAIARG